MKGKTLIDLKLSSGVALEIVYIIEKDISAWDQAGSMR
jgi:hypothetical protein